MMNHNGQRLTPLALEAASLGETQRREMFALFERYYECTSYTRFAADLADKDRVIVLRDDNGALCGFSTLAVYERLHAAERLRVIFSGDTVVDELHWGQQALASAWLRLAGEIKAEQPSMPLYWFLISKGHRTYRYLSAFSREFFPAPDRAVPARMAELMAFLARDRFGDAYDPAAGVLRFDQSHGHLRDDYARVTAAHLQLREVAYFLARNPGYARGEELVCLCELSADNLQPMARRAFLAGSAACVQP
jgi:hypothetical protein